MPITKQTIAIIGVGGMFGSAIAKSIADDNYRLLLFDEAPEKLSTLTKEIRQRYSKGEVQRMDCAFDCSWQADIVVLAISDDRKKEGAKKNTM